MKTIKKSIKVKVYSNDKTNGTTTCKTTMDKFVKYYNQIHDEPATVKVEIIEKEIEI